MSISRPNQTDRLGSLPVSKCFLDIDASRLSGNQRLQAERTEAGVRLRPLPLVLLARAPYIACK